MKLGTTEGTLSDAPVRKCLQDFGLTASQLAKRAKTLGTRGKWKALLYHRKNTAEIAKFEDKLRKIWTDIGFLVALNVRETRRGLLPLKLKPMAAIPSGAFSLPDYHVERIYIVEKLVSKRTASGAPPRRDSPSPHVPRHGWGGQDGSGIVCYQTRVCPEVLAAGYCLGQGRSRREGPAPHPFEGLARQVGAANTATPHGVPHTFDSLDAVVQHLNAVTRSASPRLVILDDVWEREVVDALVPTGS